MGVRRAVEHHLRLLSWIAAKRAIREEIENHSVVGFALNRFGERLHYGPKRHLTIRCEHCPFQVIFRPSEFVAEHCGRGHGLRQSLETCAADRVSLFYDQAFIKEPGTQSATDWHQDLPFWPALGNDLVSLWVALTPVTVEGSGVEYVAERPGLQS